MLIPEQFRAARALVVVDQAALAKTAGFSLPVIQRMEANEDYLGEVIDTLTKVVAAPETGGFERIGENALSAGGGRGVRLRELAPIAKGANKRDGGSIGAKRRSGLPRLSLLQ